MCFPGDVKSDDDFSRSKQRLYPHLLQSVGGGVRGLMGYIERRVLEGSGTFLLFSGLRRFAYLVRRVAGRRTKLMYATTADHARDDFCIVKLLSYVDEVDS